ncbi:MAG TPA: hypothetical protein VHM89_13360 [Acidimicrobiales bacterium]|nr:hypothetical protein [Acidimicrobiales bacterium]
MGLDGLSGKVLGLIVVGVVTYVGLRAYQARRRGEDAVAAAADALRDVGPPALAAGVGLVVAVALTGFAGVLFVLALIGIIFRRDDGGALLGMVILLVVSGLVLFGSVTGALAWAIARGRRRTRD